MKALRLTTIQSSLHWENIPANLEMFDQKLQPLSGRTDIVVLPEMFTTGFSMEAKKLAESMDGSTIDWMIKQSKTIKSVILGSFIAVEDGNY